MLLTTAELAAEPSDTLARAGWEVRPEGACRGPVCVPLDEADDLRAAAGRLGMAVVVDEDSGQAALGPASVSGRALAGVEAPELELPFVLRDGVWRLAEQRGRRTVIVAWAPW